MTEPLPGPVPPTKPPPRPAERLAWFALYLLLCGVAWLVELARGAAAKRAIPEAFPDDE